MPLCGLWIFKALSLEMTFHPTKYKTRKTSAGAVTSLVLPSHSVVVNNVDMAYAQSLREYRYGMTFREKRGLADKLEVLYSEWENRNVRFTLVFDVRLTNCYQYHPGTGITSIIDLLIQYVLPRSIPFTKHHVWYPLGEKLSAYNEFVLEGLRTLEDFAYVPVDDIWKGALERLRALAKTYEQELKFQVRSDLLRPVFVSDMLAISTEILRTYLALESAERPRVSSFTQAEFIERNWLNWCVDELNIDEKLARVTEMDENALRESKGELVDALVSIQLAAARIQLVESSFSTFNLQQSNILLNQLVQLREAFVDYVQKCRSITWTYALGTEASHYLGKIESAPLGMENNYEASSEADLKNVQGIPDYVISMFHLLPTPENVPREYLELATRYHQLVLTRVGKISNVNLNIVWADAVHLSAIYGKAASAAGVDENDGPIDYCSWAVHLSENANLLRRAYAEAADARYRTCAELLHDHRYGMTYYKYYHLQRERETLYWKWKDPNDPYGSGINSIAALLIDTIIPEAIPFTEENVRELTDDMSLAHNEFVWEGLQTLENFAHFRVLEVDRGKLVGLCALVTTAKEKLKTQIRSIFFGSADVLDISTEVSRTYLALESAERPRVSSFTQAVFIETNWRTWCVDELYIDEKVARLTYLDEDALRESKEEFVDALASIQLAAGKIQLIGSSLSMFLEQRKHLSQSACLKSHDWDRILCFMRKNTAEYQAIARGYIDGPCSRWTNAEARRYLETVNSELEEMTACIGINSVSARDHGASTSSHRGVVQWLSQRVMTEHEAGHTTLHTNARQHHGTGNRLGHCRCIIM
ncbi:hypothetical protein SeLEV6574_g07630 [Synchytrium endobioticum]|uniref:Uncharacterized protein n=1 Tax=Synchytrium endobioticum TaxID=286115 RepID=A0A507CB23_9FUNG|nr:hypothetical protein SeLEV6574_g07630 [Synchytrium endobioticum]